MLLSKVDNLYNELLADERALGEMSDHMLSGVKVKFGRDRAAVEWVRWPPTPATHPQISPTVTHRLPMDMR